FSSHRGSPPTPILREPTPRLQPTTPTRTPHRRPRVPRNPPAACHPSRYKPDPSLLLRYSQPRSNQNNPANSSHEHQQQQREANRPAGEMAQESLRLVCPPVSAHEGRLPRQYTLEGQGAKKDISPPLEWYGVPDGTRSLAVVVQDVDADERVPWTHWVVVNISPEEKGLPE
uniref:Phosphatidylethanolamine-binding protein n=1 Tax=Aegilops tauschii subsp. strangulata TaxID=200361 RepID=A0A452ZBY0_AEGTS